MTTTSITARATLPGGEVRDGIKVLNPGDGFGRTYLVEIGMGFWPLFLIVEADSVSDVIDVVADHPVDGKLLAVADADLGDYPEESRHYGPSGQVLDLDNMMVYGPDRRGEPGYPCRYYGDGCGPDGMAPTEYGQNDNP